jgi:CRISPR-associated protein Csh2
MRGINRLISTFNLLRFIDVRLFGATFAVQKKEGTAAENVSIHGPVQINHAINKFGSDGRYSEAILSPFRTQKEERASETEENQSSTLGNQTNVQEVHYVYHFSINPKNLYEYYKLYENRSGRTIFAERTL